ncbi:hypothetical protein [Rhizobium phage RHph_X2_26]|nr:hypothetical protein [Rhizobium phage RHph_X2_26]
MAKLTRKDLHAVVAPMAKAAHRAVNAYCVGQKFVAPPGFVRSHNLNDPPQAGAVEWEGFTLEVTSSRRARVVCNVPTPFSLFTFNYCLKRDGKQLAHGTTIPEFLDAAMRAVKKLGM